MQELITIKFSDTLEIGNYTLKLRWNGYGNDIKFSGMYRAVDQDGKNNSKYLVVTNLRPTFARTVFPCWDEPGFKANYEISIIHHKNYTALSNMPKKTSKLLNNDRVITYFDKSMPISSYQVSIVVADYNFISNKYGNVTFYAPKGDLNLVEYALSSTELMLPILERYTGIPYVLPKLDSVAVPQFLKPSMAVESWGLITYKSQKVKSISNNSTMITYPTKITIFKNVANEVVQQWFGSLVTPFWWNDLWVCKGISLYLQYKFINQLYPELEAIDFETIDTYQFLFLTEALVGNVIMPMGSIPDNTLSIKQKFNMFYNMKSFVIIQMLEHIVTQEVFQAGLQQFLKNNQFRGVTSNDLWSSLQEAYNKKFINNSLNIKNVMEPWINQRGFPILNVTRDYDTGLVTITQSNVLANRKDTTWSVPISYATQSNPNFSSTVPVTWIKQNERSITLSGVDPDDWIILNVQQRGYYKVNYDVKNLKRIINYLHSDNYHKIHPINRARILDDIYESFTRNYDYYKLAVDLIGYLSHEKNYVAWFSGVDLIDRIIKVTSLSGNNLFRNYINIITKNIINDIGMTENENDSKLVIRLRRSLLSIICQFDTEKCKPTAHYLYESLINKTSQITNLKSIYPWVLCNVFQDFNSTEWDNMFSHEFIEFTKSSNYNFEYLHCTKSDKIIEKYFNKIISNMTYENINNLVMIFDNIIHDSQYNHTNFILDYFITNFDALENKFLTIGNKNVIPHIIKQFTEYLEDQELWEKFIRFIQSRALELNNNYEIFKNNVMEAISSYVDKKDYESDYFEFIYDNRLETLEMEY
ncbi:aminopeptidase N-like [Microplitis mediator]|uniref:aminopeptidase N-like n=1 Tax=Microplitis mediator TaxID=375433 RepID=UPI002556EC21|nr:aminopeptidase N-like [Microplitis mediator]